MSDENIKNTLMSKFLDKNPAFAIDNEKVIASFLSYLGYSLHQRNVYSFMETLSEDLAIDVISGKFNESIDKIFKHIEDNTAAITHHMDNFQFQSKPKQSVLA